MAIDRFDEAAAGLLSEKPVRPRACRWLPRWLLDGNHAIVALLAVTNLVAVAALVWIGFQAPWSPTHASMHPEIAIVPTLPRKPVRFHWNTPYSSPNDTQSALLWDAINTAHGGIAVDHDVAAEQHWLKSMSVPGEDTKGLYLLESYHQLHCLKIVRKLFFESLDGTSLSYPVQHARHCFDYFRQFIICHADNTPLYSIGDHTSGDGQMHICNDWTALREYATENSACFHDRVGDEPLEAQFGQCDNGDDGVLVD